MDVDGNDSDDELLTANSEEINGNINDDENDDENDDDNDDNSDN
jgi:hypothetical protein